MSKTVRPFEFAKEFMRIHNSLFDIVMPSLGPNSWKVYCFIIRKTWGYSKDTDAVSYSQIAKGCGISSPQTVSSAIKELRKGNYIFTSGEGWETTQYRLNDQLEIDKGRYENRSGAATKIVVALATKIVDTKDIQKKQKKLRAIACEYIQDSAINHTRNESEGVNVIEGQSKHTTGSEMEIDKSHALFLDSETQTNRLIDKAKGAENEKDMVKAFFRITGNDATKKRVDTCIAASREAINLHINESDLEGAYAKSKEGKGFFVADLWALVKTASVISQERRASVVAKENPDWEWRYAPSGEPVLFGKFCDTVYRGNEALVMAKELGVPAL